MLRFTRMSDSREETRLVTTLSSTAAATAVRLLHTHARVAHPSINPLVRAYVSIDSEHDDILPNFQVQKNKHTTPKLLSYGHDKKRLSHRPPCATKAPLSHSYAKLRLSQLPRGIKIRGRLDKIRENPVVGIPAAFKCHPTIVYIFKIRKSRDTTQKISI